VLIDWNIAGAQATYPVSQRKAAVSDVNNRVGKGGTLNIRYILPICSSTKDLVILGRRFIGNQWAHCGYSKRDYFTPYFYMG
jgi:hypothetical protein